MRKTISVVLAVVSISAVSYNPAAAQRNYVGLSFGASIPSEEFASTSLMEDGGFAQNGFVLDFSLGYIFDYYFGVAATATFSNNPPDRAAYGEELKKYFDGQLPSGIEANINMGNWQYANIMAGPLLTLPAWKLNFDFRGVVGMSFLLSPPQELYVTDGTDEFFERRSGQSVTFAYMLGTAVRFNINEGYGLRLSADYFHSRQSFDVAPDGIVGTITGKNTYDMSVGTVNINLGIFYRF